MNKRRLKNKGFVSIYLVLFLSIFIPILFFFTTEYPILISHDAKIKRMLDTSSASAVLELNEDKIKEGIIFIDESSKDVALEVIKKSFLLNDDLSVTQDSFLADTPTITITIVNTPQTIDTLNGTFHLKNPSIVVEGEFPVKSILKGELVKIKHTSISQAKFRE